MICVRVDWCKNTLMDQALLQTTKRVSDTLMLTSVTQPTYARPLLFTGVSQICMTSRPQREGAKCYGNVSV